MSKVNGRISAEPDLVGDLLIQSAALAEHGQRWLDAAQRGYALHRLRQERARCGYVAFPVWDYLAGLAKQAGISLDTALAAFELDSQPVIGRQSARRIAEVLCRIGCLKEQALQMIRLSFADVHGFSLRSELALAHRAGIGTQDWNACEEALGRAESTYPSELRAELEEVRSLVTEGYVKGE